MNTAIVVMLGIASVIVGLVRLVIYLQDIFHGKTKPERASWWIWLVIAMVLLAAQWSGGATWSLGLTISQVIMLATVAVLSLRYGYGRFKRRDILALVFTALGLIAWWYTQNPFVAISIMILVDISGHVLNYIKVWQAPQSESLGAWILAAIVPMFALMAALGTDPVVYMYPLYCMVFNWGFVVLIILRRKMFLTESTI